MSIDNSKNALYKDFTQLVSGVSSEVSRTAVKSELATFRGDLNFFSSSLDSFKTSLKQIEQPLKDFEKPLVNVDASIIKINKALDSQLLLMKMHEASYLEQNEKKYLNLKNYIKLTLDNHILVINKQEENYSNFIAAINKQNDAINEQLEISIKRQKFYFINMIVTFIFCVLVVFVIYLKYLHVV